MHNYRDDNGADQEDHGRYEPDDEAGAASIGPGQGFVAMVRADPLQDLVGRLAAIDTLVDLVAQCACLVGGAIDEESSGTVGRPHLSLDRTGT